MAWDGEDSHRPRTTFSRFANRDRLFTVKFVIDEGSDKTAFCYQITIQTFSQISADLTRSL